MGFAKLVNMRRHAMDPECIASMGHSSKRRKLEIEYRERGDVYLYFDVPPEEYAALHLWQLNPKVST